jgi:hypothetical protein
MYALEAPSLEPEIIPTKSRIHCGSLGIQNNPAETTHSSITGLIIRISKRKQGSAFLKLELKRASF